MKGCNCCKKGIDFGQYDLNIIDFGYAAKYLHLGTTQGRIYSEDMDERIYYCPICGANLVGIYDMNWLKEQIKYGKTFDYIFFWGADNSNRGNTKGIYSQWRSSKFIVDGETFANTEQFMMAAKARIFGDEETRKKIMSTNIPKEIKALGREVKNFDKDIWDDECRKVVLLGNYYKFSQNEDLKKYLLETKDAILVEASPYDSIWGIAMSEEDPEIKNPLNWKGTNYLGFCIMTVRDILSGEQDLEYILRDWKIESI